MKTKTNFKKEVERLKYNFYGDETIPLPDTTSGTIEVFTVGKYTSDNDLEKEYEVRGLIPADPVSILTYWKDSDIKYLVTHWKDAEGKWCFSTFHDWRGGRSVFVRRSGDGWYDGWWFAGVRKSELGTSVTQTSSDTRFQSFVSELKDLIKKYETD